MHKCIALALWIMLSVTVNAQPSNKSLTVGDVVSDVELSFTANYPSASSRLSGFKDKLVILDFWATWCSACHKAFPKLDSLQTIFSTQLQVLLVNSRGTGDNENKITAFVNKWNSKHKVPFRLPIVSNDTTLEKLFGHRYIPHYVWIKNGKVRAITASEEVNEKNIRAVLNEEPVVLKLKWEVMDYDMAKPLLENNNGGSSADMLYNSLFTGKLEGMDSGSNYWKDSTAQRYIFLNSSPLALYQMVLGFPSNRIILDVPDPLQYIGPSAQLYSYEFTSPINCSKKKAQQMMLQDLNGYLGLNGRMEKRKVKCIVLKMKKPVPGQQKQNPANNAGTIAKVEYKEEGRLWYFQNQPLSRLMINLNYSSLDWPLPLLFVDETGYLGKITIEIPATVKEDVHLLRKSLDKLGIQVLKTERMEKVFVLTDRALLFD